MIIAVERKGEPMGRPIDGDALEELFREVISGIAKRPDMNGSMEHMIRASAMVIEMIKDAPTIESEQKWIPCSETTDIPDHEILACDKYGEMMFGYLVYEDEQWICTSDGCEMVDPIAWREKPKPYGGEPG